MKNKNSVLLVLVAIAFLIGGYFLGVQKSQNNNLSNVSTTTNNTTGISVASTTSSATSTNKVVVKKPVSVTTSNYIRIGQRVLINGVYVTPIKVAYDSRCPVDVQCIQAGSVDLGVLLESGSLSQNVIITSSKPIIFAGKEITLVTVSPVKKTTVVISDKDYRFLITVKNK